MKVIKDGTEVYFGGRMLLEDIVVTSEADVKMLMGLMDRFAAKNNFEITDMSFQPIGIEDDKELKVAEQLKHLKSSRKPGSQK